MQDTLQSVEASKLMYLPAYLSFGVSIVSCISHSLSLSLSLGDKQPHGNLSSDAQNNGLTNAVWPREGGGGGGRGRGGGWRGFLPSASSPSSPPPHHLERGKNPSGFSLKFVKILKPVLKTCYVAPNSLLTLHKERVRCDLTTSPLGLRRAGWGVFCFQKLSHLCSWGLVPTFVWKKCQFIYVVIAMVYWKVKVFLYWAFSFRNFLPLYKFLYFFQVYINRNVGPRSKNQR